MAATACGDDSAGSGGSGSGDGGGSGTSDGVTLRVRSVATSADAIEGVAPDSGDAFVIVELTLENESDDSLSLVSTAFAVQDEGGLEYHGHVATELIAGGCESDASVSPGGEATCTVVFSAPTGVDLDALVYEWEDGRVEASLSADGSGGTGGGGNPSGTCAERAVGTYVMALSFQLAQTKPIFFDAAVTSANGAISISLTPLATPYIDTGVTPMEPVPPSIALGPFPVGEDGAFTATLPEIFVPGAANSITGSDLAAAVTLQGTACPGDSNGAFCGTVSGDVTQPIDLQLDPEKNFFAFNEPGAPLTYDCSGSVAQSP